MATVDLAVKLTPPSKGTAASTPPRKGTTPASSPITRISTENVEMKKDRRKLHVLLPSNHLQELAELKNEVKEMKEEYDKKLAAMEKLAKLLFPQTSTDQSTHRIQQLAASVKDEELIAADIPTKYWPFLRNLRKYVEERNAAAHESAEEFAILLLSFKKTEPDTYSKWAPAFSIAYKTSVEEMAKQALELYGGGTRKEALK
ncbi:hypothetical protein V8E54_002980 [Elaphomyces granulatus]